MITDVDFSRIYPENSTIEVVLKPWTIIVLFCQLLHFNELVKPQDKLRNSLPHVLHSLPSSSLRLKTLERSEQ